MSEQPLHQTTRMVLVSFAGGFGAAIAIILLTLATGQTFGQRCAGMYPDNLIAQDQCVERLANGR